MKIPMLDFYRQNQASPVRQEIDNLKRHFERRSALYTSLGVLPLFVSGRSVLEIGPGSGMNALYTSTLNPKRYELVEGNPTGVRHINELFSKFKSLKKPIRIHQKTLSQFSRSTNQKYELVLCEGVLGGFSKPKSALQLLYRLTAPSGILVITTIDSISTLAENVRRLCAYRCYDRGLDTHAQAELLTPLLSTHLDTLPGMSRFYRDWVIDNIILPIGAGYNLLPIPDVISSLPPTFDFHSSSPRFVQDLRWYKDIVGNNYEFRTPARRSYWESVHNFIDYRIQLPPRDEQDNRELEKLCSSFRRHLVEFEKSEKVAALKSATAALKRIIGATGKFSSSTARALDEARIFLNSKKFVQTDLTQMKYFRLLFGRTMQYVSLVNTENVLTPGNGSMKR